MKKKMVKFITKVEFQNGTHWSYCEANKIPCIEISEHTVFIAKSMYDFFVHSETNNK